MAASVMWFCWRMQACISGCGLKLRCSCLVFMLAACWCVCVCVPGTTVSKVPLPSRTQSCRTHGCWLSFWSAWSSRRARNSEVLRSAWARWEAEHILQLYMLSFKPKVLLCFLSVRFLPPTQHNDSEKLLKMIKMLLIQAAGLCRSIRVEDVRGCENITRPVW